MSTQVARQQVIKLLPFIYAERALTGAFDPAPNLTIARGTVMGQVTGAVNDVYTITMTGTAGQWSATVSNNGGTYTAANLAFNISTAALQTAIQALPNVGANATVTGTAGTSYVVTGAAALAGGPIGTITVDPTNGASNPLTGGTASAAHTTTDIILGQIKPYAAGNSDGSQIPVGIAMWDFVTDNVGEITLGLGGTYGLTQGHGVTNVLYISGFFREAELVGLDANAVTALKAREFNQPDGTKLLMIPGP